LLPNANSITTTYGYSLPRDWLTSVNTVAGATVIQNRVYGRDAAGRITGVASSLAGESWSYGYDDLDWLLSPTHTDTPALTQSFTYDSTGNMTSNSAIGTYTYPAPGSARPHAVTSTPLGSYGYDANGNMVSAPGDTLTYDGENRLASVNSVQFRYGPDGERIKKIGAGTTVFFGGEAELSGGILVNTSPATPSAWARQPTGCTTTICSRSAPPRTRPARSSSGRSSSPMAKSCRRWPPCPRPGPSSASARTTRRGSSTSTPATTTRRSAASCSRIRSTRIWRGSTKRGAHC
jgi:hypothetical protein